MYKRSQLVAARHMMSCKVLVLESYSFRLDVSEASCSANSEAPLATPASAAAAAATAEGRGGVAVDGAPAWRWLAELAVLSDEPLDTGVRPREGPEPSLRLGAARVDDRVPVPTALEGADSRTERRAGKKRRSERRERIERPERNVEVFVVDCDRVVLTPAPGFSGSSSSLQGSLGLAMAVSSAHSSSSSRPLSSSLEARTNTGHRTGLDWKETRWRLIDSRTQNEAKSFSAIGNTQDKSQEKEDAGDAVRSENKNKNTTRSN